MEKARQAGGAVVELAVGEAALVLHDGLAVARAPSPAGDPGANVVGRGFHGQ